MKQYTGMGMCSWRHRLCRGTRCLLGRACAPSLPPTAVASLARMARLPPASPGASTPTPGPCAASTRGTRAPPLCPSLPTSAPCRLGSQAIHPKPCSLVCPSLRVDKSCACEPSGGLVETEACADTRMCSPCSTHVLFRHFGDSFKWLFYGDDDSVLFLQGAMHIVAGLDPELPYALTGMPCTCAACVRNSSVHA